MTHDHDMNRRRLIALIGGGLAGAVLPGAASAQQGRGKTSPASAEPRPAKPAAAAGPAAPGRKFFSASEFATLDEMAEAIIPADANSGGAKAAKVAEYIDARLGESLDLELRQSWRDDLAEINRLANGQFGKAFVAANAAERNRLLERLSRNERNPKEAGEHAFATIKWQVSFVYYKTKIGIHDELQYQGNVLLDEFLGLDPSKG